MTLLMTLWLAQVPSGPDDWPQWRGPNRDGISAQTGLKRRWPKEGPPVLWRVDTVGAGYASVSIKDGRIFTQGDLDGVEHVIALSAKDGSRLWAVQADPAARRLEERVAEEFKGLDRNGDGVVDEAEALAGYGWDFNRYDRPTEGDSAGARAARLFALLDADKDSTLAYAEAGAALRDRFASIDAGDPSADAAALAKRRTAAFMRDRDKNRDGAISREEAERSALQHIFESTDQPDNRLTAEEIEAFLIEHEAGKDGRITPEELAAAYTREGRRGDGRLTRDELRSMHGGYRDGTGDGPRGTPTVDGDRVYAEGALGDLTCLEAATGRTIWHVHLESDLGGGRPGWGYCESPLVLGDWLIVTPGGERGTVAALDKRTGKEVWRSKELTEGAQYSSPIVAEIGGVRQIVQFAESCFGVAAADGKFLWKYGGASNGTANVCTPIAFEDAVFASSSYGTGGGLARIVRDGAGQKAEQVYFERRMANHHGGIVKFADHLYGFGEGSLICMDFRTGKIAWQARSVGKGSLVVADGMLVMLGEGHEVALAEATPEAYRELGRFRIDGHGNPSWAHPVVAAGRLYLRDQQTLTAYALKEQ
jgi:outer membrane protein assembly factor BamB